MYLSSVYLYSKQVCQIFFLILNYGLFRYQSINETNRVFPFNYILDIGLRCHRSFIYLLIDRVVSGSCDQLRLMQYGPRGLEAVRTRDYYFSASSYIHPPPRLPLCLASLSLSPVHIYISHSLPPS
jgi:hypothetical protein